jgi:hypothetical protein
MQITADQMRFFVRQHGHVARLERRGASAVRLDDATPLGNQVITHEPLGGRHKEPSCHLRRRNADAPRRGKLGMQKHGAGELHTPKYVR